MGEGRQRQDVFERLTQEYGSALRRLVAAYEPRAVAQQDLLQEIAVAVWTALPRFRGDSSERTWIYRIAHNVASTARFRARRQTGREVSIDTLERAPRAQSNPELLADQQSRNATLAHALRRLPTLDFQIATLHLEELSNAEIADVVGLQPGAVATRLTRIRQKLTADINHQGGSR